MAVFGDAIRKLGNKYNEARQHIKDDVAQALEETTQIVIEEAEYNTPPVDGEDDRGIGQITYELKKSWRRDSITYAQFRNDEIYTVLWSKTPYASFVNDGHTLDKHFVNHLHKNYSTGLLDKLYHVEGGLVVGTLTSWIEGRFMKEAAIEKFHKEFRRILGKGALSYSIKKR